jgi:hypothetical protein
MVHPPLALVAFDVLRPDRKVRPDERFAVASRTAEEARD